MQKNKNIHVLLFIMLIFANYAVNPLTTASVKQQKAAETQYGLCRFVDRMREGA